MGTNLREMSEKSNAKSLEGRVAIITGSSRGIGSAIATELARNGAEVVVNYNSSQEAAEKIVDEIEQFGGIATAIQANVSNYDEALSLVERTQAHFGKVDLLINNAGITRDRTFRKLSEPDWNEVIDTNLNSIYHTTSAVINPMIEQNFGRIINISSIVGQAGAFGQTNYAASKAGVIGLTKSLALETARNGVTVNAVCPGYVATEMVMEIPENVREKIVSNIPMQRLGELDEIADAVLFLINSSYITGQTINVNGGAYM